MSIDRHATRSTFDTDLDDLRSALSRMIFPALQDEVLAPPNIFLFEHLDLRDTGLYGILPMEANIRYLSAPTPIP